MHFDAPKWVPDPFPNVMASAKTSKLSLDARCVYSLTWTHKMVKYKNPRDIIANQFKRKNCIGAVGYFQWRIQDFPGGGVNTPNFPENCMKSKEFGRPGGGACVPHAPLDPPMILIINGLFLEKFTKGFRPNHRTWKLLTFPRELMRYDFNGGCRISGGGSTNMCQPFICKSFAENCMKIKEFGSEVRVPGPPPGIRHWILTS